MVIENLHSVRDEIFERMKEYFDDLEGRIDLPWWTEELTVEFRKFAMSGKAIRGSLVVLAHDLFSGAHRSAAIDAGVAIELFHSAILIHDDIMDRDATRRGFEATHVRLARGRDERTGDSLAICIGDCGFFLSYDILSRLDLDKESLSRVLSHYSLNLAMLGLAQMQDVSLARSDEMPSEEDIEQVLIEKSGRYTFSLPLSMGAMIAGALDHVRFLELYGEHLGFVFQVKDDEIGLFGDPKVTGKPVGNDIREGKKTLFWHGVANHGSDDSRALLEVFGDRDASDDAVSRVLLFIESSGIRGSITKRMVERAMALRTRVEEEDFSGEVKVALTQLIEWNLSRSK